VIELDLDLPNEVRGVGEWQRAEGTPYVEDPELSIYEGTASFVHELELASAARDSTVTVDIHYQVCNGNLCFPPKTVAIIVAL